MNYTATCELADTSEVKRSLKVLVPENDIVEIRALEACERNSGWPANFSGYFDNPDAAAAAVTNFSQFFGAYWTLNQLQPELIAKSCNRMKRQRGTGKATSDSHVIGLRWVLIDCDAQRLSGISSTNEELAASRDFSAKVRKALSDRGFPEPVTANSGNGFHLLYRVNLPVGDVELVERFLKGLAAEFDTTAVHVDTGVFKLSQLCKLYGTMACKGDHTDDRPHRMSRIIAAPADSFADMPIVSRELLESQAVAKEPETEPDLTASASHRMNGETTGEEWLADWLARHGLPVTNPASNRGGVRYQIKENPLCEHEAPDAIVGVTSKGAIYAKCSHNSCSWNWHDLRAAVEGVSGRGNERPSTSQAGDQSTEKRAAPKIHYKWMTSAELDAAEYKIEYLVERTLVAGQPCVLVGPKKCLKTSLLVDLGIAIATGGHVSWIPASVAASTRGHDVG